MLDLTFKRWLSALCWSVLLVPVAANAAGLGRLTILSGLGQPLNAEIELVSPQKGETLTARLGSIDLYQQANLPYNPALVGARVTVERRADGRPYIKVSTPLRVSEPFAELLIELNSENGRVTRQYTVLLDPPGYGRAASEIPPPAVAPPAVRPQPPTQEARASAAAPVPSPSEPSVRAPTARAPLGKTVVSSPAAPSSASTPIKQYGPVKRGETLGRIARTVQPEGVSLEQTLVGLFRQNPDAFLKKNMNLVKSGRILKVPEPSELAGLPQREAVTEVRLQTADFESFRGRLADRAGTAAEAGSVTSGRIGARVAGREPAEPRDTLRVSRAETSSQSSTKGSPDRLRALEEEMVAREKALADANDRIAQLEKTIKDMQRLAQMKSAGATPPAATGPGTVPQTSGGMGTVPSSAVVAPAAPSSVPPAPGAVAVLPAPPAVDAGAKPAGDAKPGEASQPVDAAPQATSAKPAAPAPAPPAAAPQPAPATDMVDLLLGEPLYLAAGGAVLVAGLALVAVRRRRSDPDRVVKIAPTLGSGGIRSESKPEPVSPRRVDEATSPAVNTSARYAPPASPIVSAPPPATSPSVLSPRPATAAPEISAAPKAASPATAAVAMPTPPPAAPQPPSPLAQVPAASDAGDDNDLDFNAGSPYAPPAIAPSPTTPGLATTVPVTPAPARPPATPPESVEAASSRKLKTLQDTFEKSLAQSRGAESSPREISFADFSLDDSNSEPQAKPPTGGDRVSNELTFEPLPAIDLPPDVKPSASAPDLDFKLTDLNLDGAGPTPAGVPRDEHWYDVQQKFDLAKAYQEMGDKEGAREILGEVLKEGDSAQQAQAQKVLSSLV